MLTVSFNTQAVAQTQAPTPSTPLPSAQPIAKKRGRKPRVYTMTKIDGDFVVKFT